jgi:hypothetical protein
VERILDLDRRWIFLAMGVLVASLYAFGAASTLKPDPAVQKYYDAIEALPEGSTVIFAADFDPASAAELEPMYLATLHHLFRRNIRLISLATWPAAPPFSRKAFDSIAPQYGKVYGKDWVELGYIVGDDVAMGAIGQSLRNAAPRDDLNKAPYDDFPILRDVGDSCRGISMLITISAGFPGILEWIPQVCNRYQVPVLAGTTAVQTPSLYPYYPRPLIGFLGAVTGATQYLQLVAPGTKALEPIRDENQRRMLVQQWTHMLIIGLIVLGNVGYFASRRRKAAA